MLNFFLVLGQIPGTDFQLTFTDMLCVVLFGLCTYLVRRHRVELRTTYFHLKLSVLLTQSHISQQLHQKHLFKLPGRLAGRTS
jgi:hypothetical protein